MEAVALLCDHAQVTQDGKLFISGAGVIRVGTPALEPPMPVNISLAIMVTIPWNETNRRHKLTVELVYDHGEHGAQRVHLAPPAPNQPEQDNGLIVAEFNAGRPADLQQGEHTLMPLALPFPGFGLPGQGSYFFDVKIDDTEVARVPFRVNSPMGAFGGYPQSA